MTEYVANYVEDIHALTGSDCIVAINMYNNPDANSQPGQKF